jgi:pimeloyl-ACP methyl ester carboxylesterase
VLLHGITDTWRTWELVLPALERRHEVLAPTLPGHAGGPPLAAEAGPEALAAAVEAMMDAAGFATAHLAGNSLGGYLALVLAARGRAESVTAIAPAGGWARDDPSPARTLERIERINEGARALAPHADAIAATPEGRRRATLMVATHGERLPPGLVAHMIRGAAACEGLGALDEAARRGGWPLDAAAIACPVRLLWGTEDRLLPWPSAAARYRSELLPHAEWIEVPGAGHAVQLDAPLETAELVLGLTAPGRRSL